MHTPVVLGLLTVKNSHIHMWAHILLSEYTIMKAIIHDVTIWEKAHVATLFNNCV